MNKEVDYQEAISRHFHVFHLFLQYYNNEIKDDEWDTVHDLISSNIKLEQDEQMANGLGKLLRPTSEAIAKKCTEFNRLFVGPDRLLAPPYETVYRSNDRVLMQADTMIIRNFYAEAGLEVAHLNQVPDDHIAFELEFICFLLHQLFNETDEVEWDKTEELYQTFFQTRFSKWVGDHCDDIIKFSQSDICTGMAMVLKAFVTEVTGNLNGK